MGRPGTAGRPVRGQSNPVPIVECLSRPKVAELADDATRYEGAVAMVELEAVMHPSDSRVVKELAARLELLDAPV